MNKLYKKVLPSLMLSIALGVTALSLSLQNKNEYKKADAYSYYQLSGTYERIVSLDQLNTGDKVIIGNYSNTSENLEIVSHFGGNPGDIYCNEDKTDRSINENGVVTLTDAYAIEFTVTDFGNRVYAFKGAVAFNNNSSDVHNGYLSTYYAYEGRPSGSRTISEVNHGLGIREESSPSDNSKWDLSITDGVIRAYNVANDLYRLGINYRKLVNTSGGICIYKKSVGTVYNVTVKTGPSNTTYTVGDIIDLSGLEVNISGFADPVSYIGNENRFFYNQYATAGDGANLCVAYMYGQINDEFIVELTVNDPAVTYTKVTSSLYDYRGQYVIASDGNDSLHVDDDDYPYYHAMDGYEGGDLEAYIDGNVIKFSSASLPFEGLILLEKIEGYYRMFVDNGTRHYIHVDSSTGELSVDYDSLEYQDKGQTAPDNTPLEVVFDTDHVYLKIANSDKVLKRSGDFKFTNGSGNVAYLFKRQSLTAAEESALNNFLHSFVDDTLICDYNGQTDDINLGNKWATLATKFNALPVSAQGALANVTYDHNQENENSIKDLIDRYDYIVSKYPSCSDFMQRGSTFIANLQQRINISEISRDFGSNNAAVVVAIVCSLLAVSCLALFIYRKKKLER